VPIVYDVNFAYRPIADIENVDVFNSFTGVKYGFWEVFGVHLNPAGIQDGLPLDTFSLGHYPPGQVPPGHYSPHFELDMFPLGQFLLFPNIFISITYQTV